MKTSLTISIFTAGILILAKLREKMGFIKISKKYRLVEEKETIGKLIEKMT